MVSEAEASWMKGVVVLWGKGREERAERKSWREENGLVQTTHKSTSNEKSFLFGKDLVRLPELASADQL